MAQLIDNVTCLACGCLCDDLVVHLTDGKINAVQQACSRSEPLLIGRRENESHSAEIEGKQVSLDTAIERAAEILADSSAPLIWGLAESTVEAQRSAIELADQLGATLDPALSPFHRAALVALQSVGISTCTLGEVKQRADVVLFWGCDPATTHPRLFERFVDPSGRFVSGSRKVTIVSAERNQTADILNEFLQIEPGSDFEVFTALRALVEGVEIKGKTFGGLTLNQLQALAAKLQAANYSVVFFGPELAQYCNASVALESLFLLVRHLNNTARCSTIGLGGPLAENVLTWLTGYPCGVNFAAGYPRYEAEGYSANRLLERGEVDALLMIGSSGIEHLSDSARNRLSKIPVIALETAQRISCEETPWDPFILIPLAQPGLHTGGTVFRMDGVPLALRAVFESNLPSVADVLTKISKGAIAKCS